MSPPLIGSILDTKARNDAFHFPYLSLASNPMAESRQISNKETFPSRSGSPQVMQQVIGREDSRYWNVFRKSVNPLAVTISSREVSGR